MKNFLVCTTVFLSSFFTALGCGYSPFGEDVRYFLFAPSYFNYQDFSAFNYHSNRFGFEADVLSGYESNVEDWYNYLDKKVSKVAISELLNELKLTDIQADSKNEFVHFLYKNKRNDILKYLKYAKRCEVVNALDLNDSWEQNEKQNQVNRSVFLKKLWSEYKTETNKYLKRKYAFLTIRVAYYANNKQIIHSLFNQEFKNNKKDYLYYWSLYFDCFFQENPFVNIASIMANSIEKRNASYYYFHDNFDVEKALANAKTKQDKANVYAYASVQKLDRNLDNLQDIYANYPQSRALSFLLIREINKIEDWVYTPYYINYLPSTESLFDRDDIETTNTLRARSEKDRLYAEELLKFVTRINVSEVENPVVWKAAEIQLLFITRKFNDCLLQIERFEKTYPQEKVIKQIEQIKALCVVSNKGFISQNIQPVVLRNLNDNRFLFALGRELEFRGNIPEGLALISMADYSSKEYYEYGKDVVWQDNRLKTSGNFHEFYNYFDYLDFVYSTQQMNLLLDKLNKSLEFSFEKIIYKKIMRDKNYLTDLLGTKYIRENNLSKAYQIFKSIGNKYWDENYNAWERDKYGDDYEFISNPFYDFKYTKGFIPHKEKYLVTKLSVTEHLIKYLNLAYNPKTRDKDYYFFLVANCYFNMSQDGNSWMMRRFLSSINDDSYNLFDSYIDQVEYNSSKLAKHYYKKAFENAKTDKFKALCLRMIDYVEFNYPNQFNLLKTSYPDFYEDLSGCENLEEFFKSRT